MIIFWGTGLENVKKSSYEEMFERNYGILSATQQERLRKTRILIVGCGGIGGTVAIILARTGIERFILVEFDIYDTTNLNRQISCFAGTLGRNKAQVIGEDILRINPNAEVEIYPRLLNHAEIAQLIPKVDVVFPAADDFAFSILGLFFFLHFGINLDDVAIHAHVDIFFLDARKVGAYFVVSI